MNKIHTLADRIGITLTPMQETVADRLLHTDRNVVVLSPTGIRARPLPICCRWWP